MAWEDVAGRRISPTCAGSVRHWFSVYGVSGVRAPVCQRMGCGADNPKALSEEEMKEYEYWKRLGRAR